MYKDLKFFSRTARDEVLILIISERNMFLSDRGPMLETLDFAFHIGSTPTFFLFRL